MEEMMEIQNQFSAKRKVQSAKLKRKA